MSKLTGRAIAATTLMTGAVLAGGGVAGGQAPSTEEFGYTGEAQSFTVPADVCEITVDAYGASGNDAGEPVESALQGLDLAGASFSVAAGGLGGRATGTVAVTPGEELLVYVGGQGFVTEGGFNGGGDGGGAEEDPGGGGGGASDVRRGAGLEGRLVVAGGGGGGGAEGTGTGGAGGGATGGDGADSGDDTPGGGGATQSAGGTAPTAFDPSATPGSLGVGGAGGLGTNENDGGGGGGGGYYGGGGGAGDDEESDDGGGGGGGSGFGPAGTGFETGVNEGDGSITLSWTTDPGCDDEPTSTTTAPAATQAVGAVRPTFTG